MTSNVHWRIIYKKFKIHCGIKKQKSKLVYIYIYIYIYISKFVPLSLVENINDLVGLDHPNEFRVCTMTSYRESDSNSLNRWDWTWYSLFEFKVVYLPRESVVGLRWFEDTREEDELPHKVEVSLLFEPEVSDEVEEPL